MLAAAKGNFIQQAATAAALLSGQDPFEPNTHFGATGSCDLDARIRAFDKGGRALNSNRAKHLEGDSATAEAR